MWEKLWWDVEVFCDIQRAYPDEIQPLVYAALNACIAAWSLEQWAKKAHKQAAPTCRRAARGEFDKLLADMVPRQAMCADIANTTKHGDYKEFRWNGGKLELRWEDGDEYSPPCYVLLQTGSGSQSSLHNSLSDLPQEWWAFLKALDLVSEPMPTPKWFRNKMSKIFGVPRTFDDE